MGNMFLDPMNLLFNELCRAFEEHASCDERTQTSSVEEIAVQISEWTEVFGAFLSDITDETTVDLAQVQAMADKFGDLVTQATLEYWIQQGIAEGSEESLLREYF